MNAPTILKGPLPGEAVERHRVTHGGALPYELELCPFCGQDEASYMREWRKAGIRSEGEGHFVKCLHCGSKSPTTATKEGCRTVWNSRSSTTNKGQ